MRRRRIAVIAIAVLAAAALLVRFVVLEQWIDARLARLQQKTGVRATYESLHLSLRSLTLRGVALYWDEEPTPSAKTEAVVIDFRDNEARWADLRVDRKGVRAALRGKIGLDRKTFDISGSLPPVPCDTLLGAMPRRVRDRLGGVKLTGNIGVDLRFRLDAARVERNRFDADLDNGCAIADYGRLPAPDSFRRPFVYRAYDRDKRPFERTAGPGREDWADFDDISRFMREAVMEAEDPLFRKHDGILLSRIVTAARVNLKHGAFRYGASTITMQTAKNLFLSREKTFERKLLELFFVWYLESNFTKDEILTLYLNLAEMGPSVYGVKAASRYYFGVRPKDLSLRQAAFLAKLLPRPTARSRARDLKRVPPEDARRIRALLKEMLDAKRITRAEHDDALKKKISFKNAGKAPGAAEAPEGDAPAVHVRRASRPRLQKLPPPLSKLVSSRRDRGGDLGRLEE